MKNSGRFTSNSTNNGNNTFDISINVEKISNDYDVDQLAARVKTIIGNEALYRNSNIISRMR